MGRHNSLSGVDPRYTTHLVAIAIAIVIHLTESWQTVGLPFVPMVSYLT